MEIKTPKVSPAAAPSTRASGESSYEFTATGTLIIPPQQCSPSKRLESQSGDTLLIEPPAPAPSVECARILSLDASYTGSKWQSSNPRGGSTEGVHRASTASAPSSALVHQQLPDATDAGADPPVSSRVVSGNGHRGQPLATRSAPTSGVWQPSPEPGPPATSLPPEHASALQPAEDKSLFRERALRSRFEAPETAPLPQVSGSRWALLLLLCSLAGLLLAVAYFGRVEVTSRAFGSLRAPGGPRPITAQASGVVGTLSVKAGDRVKANQSLAKIEARELNARVARSQQKLDLLREEGLKAKQANRQLQEKTISALEGKRGLLWQRAKLKKQQLAARQDHAARVRDLASQGAASGIEVLAAEEQVTLAHEELLALRQQAAEVGVQVADRKRAYENEHVERDFRVREAEVGLAEAEALAVLGTVSAPEAGRVESLLVTEGQVIQAGTVLARIIPDAGATSLVVFAPAKDAAFLRPGLSASLEFPSLPVSEYGKAEARVTRVASDVALPQEVSEVLGTTAGETSGLVRVEVTPINDEVWKEMAPRLHSGASVIARLKTRKRRIITLLFDFMRTWYPQ